MIEFDPLALIETCIRLLKQYLWWFFTELSIAQSQIAVALVVTIFCVSVRGYLLLVSSNNLLVSFARLILATVPLYLSAAGIFFLLISPVLALLYAKQLFFESEKVVFGVIKFVDAAILVTPIALVLGVGLAFSVGRVLEPKLNKLVISLSKNNSLLSRPNDNLIDVPGAEGDCRYDPLINIENTSDNSIFLGLSESSTPIFENIENFKALNCQVVGPPGTGKTVFALNCGVQIVKKIGIFIFGDPKGDEYAPSVLQHMAKSYNAAYTFIDLAHENAQINILKGTTKRQKFELLCTATGLQESGSESDFYRLQERKLLKKLIDESNAETLQQLIDDSYELLGAETKNCSNLMSKLQELASIDAMQALDGMSLEDTINEAGFIYIKGSMRDERIKAAQRLLIVRLIQIVENRENDEIHVCCFLDEVKFFMCRALLDSFGVVRSKNMNFLIAHQSLSDTAVPISGIDSSEATSTINDNCQIRLIYRSKSPDVVKWASEQSGKMLTYQASKKVTVNSEGAEIVDEDSIMRAQQSNVVDENTILHLPKMHGVLIGPGRARIIKTAPILVEKSKLTVERFQRVSVTKGDPLL